MRSPLFLTVLAFCLTSIYAGTRTVEHEYEVAEFVPFKDQEDQVGDYKKTDPPARRLKRLDVFGFYSVGPAPACDEITKKGKCNKQEQCHFDQGKCSLITKL